MKRPLFFLRYNPPSSYVQGEIALANATRVRVFAAVLCVVHLFLLYRDVFINRPSGLWERNIGYQHLCTMHVILVVVTTLFFVVSFPVQKLKRADCRNRSMFNAGFSMSILLWCAVLAGWVNQYEHGMITEYILAIFGIAAAFYFSPIASFVLLGTAQIVFMITLAVVLPEPNKNAHYTNSVILVIIGWFLARTSFIQQARVITDATIIEEQAHRLENTNIELTEQNEELASLNHDMQELLGIAAHDLKNPLAAIVLSMDIVEHSLGNAEAVSIPERLQRVRELALRMSAIINNVLGSNAIETGKMVLRPEVLAIEQLVAQVVDGYAEPAARKNITLVLEPAPPDATAFADANALTEILDNLVSNAVKYSPLGYSVWVSISSDGTSTLIRVKDEGPGFTDDDKQKLFSKFTRLSAQPTGGEHSTGLGLSIVKKMVEVMNGRIWCESEHGNGATFVVEIPACETALLWEPSTLNVLRT